MIWKLPSGQIISAPAPVTIDGVQHPADIFYNWSVEELGAIGIKRLVRQNFDRQLYRTTGAHEEERDGVIYVTYDLAPAHTVEELKALKVEELKDSYIIMYRHAVEHESFYKAIGDSVNESRYADYLKDIKDATKDFKTAIESETNYEAVSQIQFNFPPTPVQGLRVIP